MATSFDVIYKQYFRMTNDIEIKRIYTPDYSYQVLNDYLQYAISLFGDYCYRDLNDMIFFSNEVYTFKGDGIVSSFTLTPTPPQNCNIYISINDEENSNYNFDSVNNTITFNSIPNINDNIYIGTYVIGQFNNDLDVQEINLLAEGMTIPFKQNKLDNSLLLNNSVYGTDYNPHSPANHIKELRTTIENEEKHIVQKIIQYTWKQKNKELLEKLHG